MEMLQGAPLTDLAAIQRVTAANPVDAEQTLINALNVWFGSVVMCRTFHAGVVILLGLMQSMHSQVQRITVFARSGLGQVTTYRRPPSTYLVDHVWPKPCHWHPV